MMTGKAFEVTGISKLMKRLDRIGGDSAAVVERGIADAVLKVQSDAKALCPVNLGQLRESIVTRVQRKSGEVVGTVGTNVFYAVFQEYGTGIYAANGNGRQDAWRYKRADTGEWVTTRGNKPQPFMRPALEQNTGSIMRDICDALNAAIKGVT